MDEYLVWEGLHPHVSGWNEFKGFNVDAKTGEMKYPGDPSYKPIAKTVLHSGQENEETLYFYNHAWFTVIGKDGIAHTTRLD